MRSLLLPLCIPLAAVACAHANPAPVAAAPPAPAPEVKTVYVEKKPEVRACSSDDQCAGNQLCRNQVCTDITSALEACGDVRIHFDFDKADLRSDEMPKIRRMARCLDADHGVHVLIEGNADERGTVEYNLALGDRRAAAVDKYLESLGTPAAQLATVSYGKELPLCTNHDESCWAENRRALIEPNGRVKDLAAMERRDEAREHHHVARMEHTKAAKPEAAAEGASKEQPAEASPSQK